MAQGIRLRVWGERACFTRPEMKVERISYDVITPSAARGILEAIHWKPAVLWVVDRLHVLKPIRFETIRRNELSSKVSSPSKQERAGQTPPPFVFIEDLRAQRSATLLRDVDYVIEAHFEMVPGKAGPEDNPGKHLDMFNRRARKGQCHVQPVLGCREFPAAFELVDGPVPNSELTGERDLGWMLLDIDHSNGREPLFFHATMVDGVITVPGPGDRRIAR